MVANSHWKKVGFVAITGASIVACAAMVGATTPPQNFFLGSLFPPGYKPRLSGAKLGKQSINSMKSPSDSSPIRQFATKVASQAIQVQELGGDSSRMVTLGKELFEDTTLSNPTGQSCQTCHTASAGFTLPNAAANASSGIAPGAQSPRVGNRLPPSVTYAVFSPPGPYYDPGLTAYAGGLFWDGRTLNLTTQAQQPFFNPNEMNDIVHNVADTQLLINKVQSSREGTLFREVFGVNAYNDPPQTNLQRVGQAIAAFESTRRISPFSSKYDAYLHGAAKLTDEEMNGLRLFTGSTNGRPGGPPNYKAAQCVLCHGIPSDPRTGPDVFSNFCYANIGTPKNPNNPYYHETNAATNPLGYNPLGTNYIDFGLGDFLYPTMGLPSGNMGSGNNGQGDFLAINGTFKAPSLRNLNKRPYASFPKRYTHNGYFTSLEQIVHFYNTRNLTTKPGEVIDFTQPNPYAGLQGTPLWPPPEWPSPVTLQNAAGLPGSSSAQVGNLGLTPQEEAELVAFLKTLTDTTLAQ